MISLTSTFLQWSEAVSSVAAADVAIAADEDVAAAAAGAAAELQSNAPKFSLSGIPVLGPSTPLAYW